MRVKRIASVILALIMLLSMAGTAFADGEGGDIVNSQNQESNSGTGGNTTGDGENGGLQDQVLNNEAVNGTMGSNGNVISENTDSNSGSVDKILENVTVTTNEPTGSVAENNGTINDNKGFVQINNGDIGTNILREVGEDGRHPANVNVNETTGTIDDNSGVVLSNKGEIKENNGRLDDNSGTVVENASDPDTGNFGNIITNNGTVITNEGRVGTNNGNIGTNILIQAEEGGRHPENVNVNETTGTIDDNSGVVVTNKGEIKENNGRLDDNSGTVLKNASDPDTGNFGNIFTNNGTVTTNDGRVGDNKSVVTTNNGTVQDNNKIIVTNNGDIGIVVDGETVGGNHKTVETNTNTGTIQVNEGKDAVVNKNEGTVVNNKGGTIKENTGTVGANNQGAIQSNSGTVTENNGFMGTNNDGGTVGTNIGNINTNKGTITTNAGDGNGNEGRIGTNEGTVKTNNGKVQDNAADGTVEENTGIVLTNEGLVINKEGGVVETNTGEVYNYGGTVKNNEGTEYFSVAITNGTANTSFAYGDGYKDNYDQKWISQTGNTVNTATITLTPKDGYEITSVAISGSLINAVKDEATGVWTLTFQSGANTSFAIPEATQKAVPQEEPAQEAVVIVETVDSTGNQEAVAYTVVTETKPAADALTVKGTDADTEDAIVMSVEDVLTVGTESTAFQAALDETSDTYNETFAAAAQSALTVAAGTVDFGDAFKNATESVVVVPISVPSARAGKEFTVVFSNGEIITVACDANGVLQVPFPKDAANLSYVIQDDFAGRYADLIARYLELGDEALSGESPETRVLVKAYAELARAAA